MSQLFLCEILFQIVLLLQMLVCLRILIIVLESKLNEIVCILSDDLLAQSVKLLFVEIRRALWYDHVFTLWCWPGVLDFDHVRVSAHVHHLNWFLSDLWNLLVSSFLQISN